MTDPIDNTHRDAMRVTEQIRAHVLMLRQRVAVWDLPPYPNKKEPKP